MMDGKSESADLLTRYRRARRKATRLLRFPDGMTRHITMTAAQWANYDWLIERDGVDEYIYLREVIEHAIEWAARMERSIEDEARFALRDLIAISIATKSEIAFANDNL